MDYIKQFRLKYKNEHEVDHIVDYLTNNNYGDKEIFNDYEDLVKQAGDWVRSLNEGHKAEGLTRLIRDFNDGITIVRLLDPAAKAYEGSYLNHCSASYKDETLYSLRKDGKPLYTIQYSDQNGLIQARGFRNCPVHDNYKKYILEWVKTKGLLYKNSEKMLQLLKVLNYRCDPEFVQFISDNNLEDKVMSNVIRCVTKDKVIQVKLYSTSNVIKIPKPITELKYTEDLFLFFIENNMCNDLVNFVIENKEIDEDLLSDIFESTVSLHVVKKLHSKGYIFDADCLWAAIWGCDIDVFKFLYEEVEVRGSFKLIVGFVYAGKSQGLKYSIKKGYITKEEIIEFLDNDDDIPSQFLEFLESYIK